MQRLWITFALVAGLSACGASLKLDPVTVKPIHLTVDVNVHDATAAGADVADTDQTKKP